MENNFKVKCISGSSKITKGKIYRVVNGRLTMNDGTESMEYSTVEELNHGFSAQFELVTENPTITIRTKGRDTIATLKNGNAVIKSAKATCNPSDTFDFKVGAKLAFERLMGEEVKEVAPRFNGGNFSAKCIKTKDCSLTVGKVYKFVDGYSTFDGGTKMPWGEKCGVYHFKDIQDLRKWFSGSDCSYFEEVTEQPTIDYSTLDYTKLDGTKLFEEIQRRVKINER